MLPLTDSLKNRKRIADYIEREARSMHGRITVECLPEDVPIRGNTSDATCRAILDKMANCDWYDGPELQLGQWADDPTFTHILDEIGIVVDADTEDCLWPIYSDAWYEGMQHEVERACLARIGGNDHE